VKRHQQYPGYDADSSGAGGDSRCYGQNRGEISVFDEVVLRQPNIIKAVVVGPSDLIEYFGVEPIGGLMPLRGIAEIVPKTKAYFLFALILESPL